MNVCDIIDIIIVERKYQVVYFDTAAIEIPPRQSCDINSYLSVSHFELIDFRDETRVGILNIVLFEGFFDVRIGETGRNNEDDSARTGIVNKTEY